MDLKGKTAFITGSSRGIGAAIALQFAKEGCNVILNGRKNVSDKLIKEIEALGVKCKVALGDVSQINDAKKMQTEIFEEFDNLDILVNNAGITADKLMIGMKEKDFRRVIETNLIGTFNVTQGILKKMSRQRSGVIINLASVVGLHGNLGQANYAASKAGIIGLTKTIAREGALRGVRCNAIAPGMINSDMTAEVSQKIKDQMVKDIPLQRFGEPVEVAETAVFLAKSDYITGQVITIDGGMTI
ncbi:3-oxoacyl-[acyl-carrier-protein] reductase [Liquorilactobacillus aquaticus DSM 21051]|uniref:3-oxoacyl-[acyl-carrier-protein] reductase n=1 Tax=Liquorilactobacillus aquaticus DSM 21051 TaxID=1423725 RepID=A0A0R2CVI5_9LACO|nr:3-oxoacyl-[acyl-carrier-protein] reductase [Liquorilactobacillus aquaticus]KRM95790.1 3-oxoacyl-[acyl-carrier-protein] reductase [Liquorilactobacillus aquaticus DSM 21051]